MARIVSGEEYEDVVQAVGRLDNGGYLEDVDRQLKGAIARRTLQRQLAALVESGRLVRKGQRRASRYYLPFVGEEKSPDVSAIREAGLTVSSDAQRIRDSVRAPIHARQPVGYNRDFLESYRPNETFYLPQEVRRRLAKVGQTPGGELPAGTYARQILDRLLIDLSWNSSRLEGNTYSLLETQRLLELGESAEGKNVLEAQMILNHKAAIEMLVDEAAQIGFNRYTILNLHGLLSDNLLSDPGAGGRLRRIPVLIGGTVFHPLVVPQLVEECFNQILATATAIRDPFEQSFFAMVHLPYLQPFEDVNKRVSRLAANIPLIRLNLCPLSFVDVPDRDYIDGILGVYELNRVELLRDVFVWAYQRSCERYTAVRRSLGEPDPFRLRYRQQLIAIVGEAVRQRLDRQTAAAFIRREASIIPAPDRARFVEIVDLEIASLHEGNFARFGVRPSEFEAWREIWR